MLSTFAQYLEGTGVTELGCITPGTEVYVQADLEMKRKALELGSGPHPTQAPQLTLPSSLIEWLESL